MRADDRTVTPTWTGVAGAATSGPGRARSRTSSARRCTVSRDAPADRAAVLEGARRDRHPRRPRLELDAASCSPRRPTRTRAPSGWQRQALATPLTLQPGPDVRRSRSASTRSTRRRSSGARAADLSGPAAHGRRRRNGVFNETRRAVPGRLVAVEQLLRRRRREAAAARRQRTPQVDDADAAAGATGVAVVDLGERDVLDLRSTRRRVTRHDVPAHRPGRHRRCPRTSPTTTTPARRRSRPTRALETGIAYTARLTTGIRSDDETPLPAAVELDVLDGRRRCRRRCSATSPVDGATDLGQRSTRDATFSQAMDASTITDATFTLTGPGGSAVAATVDYDPVTRVGDARPRGAPLAAATTYIARLTTGVRERARASPLAAGGARGASRPRTARAACSTTRYQPAMTDLATANGRRRRPAGRSRWASRCGVTQAAHARRRSASTGRRARPGSHTGRVWNAQRPAAGQRRVHRRDGLRLAAAGARRTGAADARPDLRRLGRHERRASCMTVGALQHVDHERPAVQRRRRRERRVRRRGGVVPDQQLGRQRLRHGRGGPMKRLLVILCTLVAVGGVAPAAAMAAPPAGRDRHGARRPRRARLAAGGRRHGLPRLPRDAAPARSRRR